mgnify:CR=1 FL=1
MAEQHGESSGLIKTPKQLIVVVVIALFLSLFSRIQHLTLWLMHRAKWTLQRITYFYNTV